MVLAVFLVKAPLQPPTATRRMGELLHCSIAGPDDM